MAWIYRGDFSASTTVKINEISRLVDVLVFPNPFTQSIALKNPSGRESFDLISLFGQVIYSGRNLAAQDFSELDSGIYFLRITDLKTSASTTLKLVKQ
jgi:hypothetical protein